MQQLGQTLFLLGILIAFATGLGIHHPMLPAGLAIFGIVVGLINVAVEDKTTFLLTGVALEVSASAFSEFSYIGEAMTDVMIFVGGALLVVAVRLLFSTALGALWQRTRTP